MSGGGLYRLIISRSFATQIEQVWEAFVNPVILKQWWFPAGMTCSFIGVDLKVHGLFIYAFENSDGNECWGRAMYDRIVIPTFLSYTETFSDSEGNPVPPSFYGLLGDMTVETYTEIEFTFSDNATHINFTVHNDTDDTSSMIEGRLQVWNDMFDRLEKLL